MVFQQKIVPDVAKWFGLHIKMVQVCNQVLETRAAPFGLQKLKMFPKTRSVVDALHLKDPRNDPEIRLLPE